MTHEDHIIVGIDYSLNSPAVCALYTHRPEIKDCLFSAIANAKKHTNNKNPRLQISEQRDLRGMDRYIANANLVSDIVDVCVAQTGTVPYVFIEGYSFGSSGQAIFDIAENCGILKYKLKRDWNIDIIPLSPSLVKKVATGKGNARKDQMYDAWLTSGGHDLMTFFDTKNPDSNPLSDIVDAYFVAVAGMRSLLAEKS
jgi:Holliday junction resolvasome RuvABC endonuclease subunit